MTFFVFFDSLRVESSSTRDPRSLLLSLRVCRILLFFDLVAKLLERVVNPANRILQRARRLGDGALELILRRLRGARSLGARAKTRGVAGVRGAYFAEVAVRE